MLRSVYAALVRLHPPAFRRHFGDEMLSIFDHTADGDRFALLLDSVTSLLRQWFFRPEFREPASSPASSMRERTAAGVPLFLVLDDDPRLTPSEWMGGSALSLLSFVAAAVLISHGGSRSVLSIGTRASSQSGVRVQSRAPAAKQNTEVAMQPADILEIDSIWRLVEGYFDDIPVLSAMDLNHNLVISAEEIEKAPEALRSLDENGDGALDPEECGKVFAGDFMRNHPVLAWRWT